MKKIPVIVGLCATFTLMAPIPAHAAPAEFETVEELMTASVTTGEVTTTNHVDPNDDVTVSYDVVPDQPQGIDGAIAIPLADGKWAIPNSIPESAPAQAPAAIATDIIDRGRSFTAAGKDLKWDGTSPTPLSGKVIHETDSKPYGVTCSSFVGMVMQGWRYDSTTYVSNENQRVGSWVDFGDAGNVWQAHKLARWLYDNGDLAVAKDTNSLQPGDILFFSKQAPEGEDTTGKYFGNVYHTALYIGDGKVIHSYGPTSETGVVEEELSPIDQQDLSFVGRPEWQQAGAASTGAGSTPTPEQEKTSDKKSESDQSSALSGLSS